MEEDKPPLLNSWSNVYKLVIAVLLAVILFLYSITKHFE